MYINFINICMCGIKKSVFTDNYGINDIYWTYEMFMYMSSDGVMTPPNKNTP